MQFIIIVGLHKPFQGGATGIISPKNQLALMLYFFRVYLKCKNIFNIIIIYFRAINGNKCIIHNSRNSCRIKYNNNNHLHKFLF